MSEYKVAESFDVYDDADYILDDLADDPSIVVGEEDDDSMYDDDGATMSVSEDEAMDYSIDKEVPAVVVEEADTIPGSDMVWEPEAEPEEKPTDWANDGDHSQFVMYVKDKLSKVPRHSGQTIPGCERAAAYLKSLDSDISKAMRSDTDGKIDESEIDAVRDHINTGVDRLESRIKQLRGNRKTAATEARLVSSGECKKCASVSPLWHDVKNDKMVCLHCEADGQSDELKKEATTPVLNVYMTPFERAIVGTIVNSKVSAGRHIEETYELMKNKYNFTPREELAIQQLIADYGYPMVKDRGRLNEESDPASGDSVDWNTNYHA